jgi:hypothetical protein
VESIPKPKWKQLVNDTITAYWQEKLKVEANKSSVRYMSKSSLNLDQPASVWTCAVDSPRETQKARVKAKLLSGAMRLQVHDALYSGGKTSATCKLCGEEAENREHFLLRCAALTEIRTHYMEQVYSLLCGTEVTYATGEDLLQILLDPTDLFQEQDELIYDLEAISRGMMFQMSRRRIEMLALLEPESKRGRSTKKKSKKPATRAKPQQPQLQQTLKE